MRRLSFLLALTALAAVVLAGLAQSVEARVKRGKLRRHAPAAAASSTRAKARAPTRVPASPPPPTSTATATPTPTTPGPTPTPGDLIPRRILIMGFDGRGAQVARGAAADALRKIPSVRVVPLRPAEAMRLGTAYAAEKTVGTARRLNLTAVLYGAIKRAKRNVRLSLQLANGEDGRAVGEITFEARSLGALRTQVRAQLWGKLEPLIDQAASPGPADSAGKPIAESEPKPPPEAASKIPTPEPAGAAPGEPPVAAPPPGEAEPKREADADEEVARSRPHARRPGAPPAGQEKEEDEEEEEPGLVGGHAAGATSTETERCSVADLEPGGGVMARRFNYRDEQRGALRAYALIRAPVARVAGTLYPLAAGHCGTSTGFGVRGTYERMGAVTSQLAGRQLATQASAYQVELVLRIVRGALTLQPAIGYLARQYHVDGDVVPNADYRAVGAGLDATLRGRHLSVELGAGAHRLFQTGTLQSADWFPGLSAYGATAHARLGLAVNEWIDVVAGAAGEYDRFNFPIVDGNPYPNGVAAGAYDLFVQATLSVRLRLGLGAARPPRP